MIKSLLDTAVKEGSAVKLNHIDHNLFNNGQLHLHADTKYFDIMF